MRPRDGGDPVRSRALGVAILAAGLAAILSAPLPWWRFPSEQVFGLGIPGHEIGGLERWHGWAAGGAGIFLVVLGGAVLARPSSARGLGISSAVAGLGALGVVAVALLGEGRAVRPGAGALLAAAAGLVGTLAGFAAARARVATVQGWTAGRSGRR